LPAAPNQSLRRAFGGRTCVTCRQIDRAMTQERRLWAREHDKQERTTSAARSQI